MHILIGSQALALQSDFDASRSDWDIISDTFKGDPAMKIEVHPFSDLENHNLKKYLSDNTINKFGVKLHVLNLEGLALVKRSHLWRDWKFNRNMGMYNKYLRGHVALDNPDLLSRTKATLKFFKEQHPKLNVSVEEFFDDAVVKVYNHDWLHEQYAHEDAPLYTKMQLDKSSAWCEVDLWNKFSHDRKIKCIQEEAYVIATERFIVRDRKFPHKLAYYNAVNKICTTLCSGWFRDYALDNYTEILDAYNPSKIKSVIQIIERIENVK